MSESEKVEGFWFLFSTFLAICSDKAPKFYQSGFVAVEFQGLCPYSAVN